MESHGERVAVETTGGALERSAGRPAGPEVHQPGDSARENLAVFSHPSKRRPGKRQNRRIPFGKGRKQPRCMRCWAARRERRGARSNSSPAGNGTACEASCRRACGNKGTRCACSCAPASACTGSKAELVLNGAQSCFALPSPPGGAGPHERRLGAYCLPTFQSRLSEEELRGVLGQFGRAKWKKPQVSRFAKMTPEERKQASKQAGQARWAKARQLWPDQDSLAWVPWASRKRNCNTLRTEPAPG